MQIAGLQKLSLIDYPGKTAAVVFTQGCNFRCPYCHNRELVLPEHFGELLSEREVLTFLRERKDKLQGVVVTGGEPTVQKGLLPFLRKVKGYGYGLKLDTNGSHPRVLEQVIRKRLIDFVAMDVKGPPERYRDLAGVPVDLDDIRSSVRIILDSGIDHVFRTTVAKPLLSKDDLRATADIIREGGRYWLQEFVPRDTVLDTTLLDRGHYTVEQFQELQREFQRDGVAV